MPHLQNYQALVSAGRSYHTATIAGLQSVAQLNAAYGRNVATAILSGNKQRILLRPGDTETVRFIQNALGKKHFWQTAHHGVPTAFGGYDIEESKHLTMHPPVSEEEILSLKPGECFVVTQQGWIRVRLQLYERAKQYFNFVDSWLEKRR